MKTLALLATLAVLLLALPHAAAAPGPCDVGGIAIGPGYNAASASCDAGVARASAGCVGDVHPPEPVVPPEPVAPSSASCSASTINAFVSPFVRVGFNPQPEPPAKWASVGVFARGSGLAFGCEVSFNPQPEPPACSGLLLA